MLMTMCNTETCYNYSKVVCLQMREYKLDGVWSGYGAILYVREEFRPFELEKCFRR